ncbi:MAG: alpha/beta hydrolase-fold protein [Phormidesmis sp.]
MTAIPVSIPDTEVHRLRSEIVEDDFELWIAKPQAGFATASLASPTLLFVLDANLCFGTAVEMTRIMHKLYGELPPILVVGVAYPTADGFRQAALRSRDFTPSQGAGLTAMAASLPQPIHSVEPPMGGADRFLRFLAEEAKPFVASRFAFAPTQSTIFGSSLGGLLVTYALLKKPAMFDNFIAVSPSLWWDNEMMFDVASTLSDWGLPKQIFLAVGGLEEAPEIPMLAQFKAITNVRRMAAQLAQQVPPLTVKLDVLPEETHTSVIPVALTRGLRSCLQNSSDKAASA